MKAAASRLALWGGVGAVLATLAVAAPASAQVGERRMAVRANARASYDSNVARGNDLVAQQRGLRKDEITYTPSVSVDMQQPLAGQTVFAAGSLGYQFHQYNSQLQSETIDLMAGVRSSLGPCGTTFQGSINRGQSDQADLDISVVKNVNTSRTLSATANCGIGQNIGVVFGLNDSRSSNEDSSLADSHTRGGTLGLSYNNETLGSLSLFTSYSKMIDDTPPGSVRRAGFEQTSYGVSLTRPIGTRLTGNASLSVSSVKSGGLNADTSTWSGAGALNYVVGPRLTTSLSYERSAGPSLQGIFNYAISSTARLSARYRVSQRVGATLSARLTERSYKGQLGPIPPNTVLDDRITGLNAATSIAIGRRGQLSFDVGREKRTTNVTQFNHSAYRVGVTASALLMGN